MKKCFIFAASALALAGCSSDDFLGDNPGGDGNAQNGVIAFQGATGKTTRASQSYGSAAADLLGKKFYVLGTKGTLPGGNPTETIVFDNYQVNYTVNSAGTAADNTNDWNYVGVDPTGLHAGTTPLTEQSIKYWDYSVPQYDFIAYSVGENKLITEGTPTDGNVLGTAIVTPKGGDYKAYELSAATINDLKECYYTDVTPVKKADNGYKQPVQLKFKNLTAKVRVAFYEVIPGYAVKDLKFYVANEDNDKRADKSNESATLYTTGTDKISSNGKITVTYPIVGADKINKAGHNKAFVNVTTKTDNQVEDLKLGNVNYNGQGFINTTAKEASMAGESANSYYTTVLPADNGKALTLRMNYTLVSNDGSGETIKVYGAKAVIPAAYTAWQPNYAYTYIFKISDNTNGYTSTDNDTEGLYPITFDAVVAAVDDVDFNQETITTVATPSVTSYAFDNSSNRVIKANGEGNEYPAATTTDIYFSVVDNGAAVTDLDSKGTLYTVQNGTTEAQVIDALQVQATTTTNSVTGRNGVVLTKVDGVETAQTTIPTDDGKTVTVAANSTAKFTATTTATTYAYVYLKANGTETNIKTAVLGDGVKTAGQNEYYTDYECENAVNAGETLVDKTVYYKIYNNNNNVYGVKVVKTF